MALPSSAARKVSQPRAKPVVKLRPSRAPATPAVPVTSQRMYFIARLKRSVISVLSRGWVPRVALRAVTSSSTNSCNGEAGKCARPCQANSLTPSPYRATPAPVQKRLSVLTLPSAFSRLTMTAPRAAQGAMPKSTPINQGFGSNSGLGPEKGRDARNV